MQHGKFSKITQIKFKLADMGAFAEAYKIKKEFIEIAESINHP